MVETSCPFCRSGVGDEHEPDCPSLPPRADAGRGSGWINTYTGRAFYPLDATVEDVDVLDIAQGLAAANRFTGQTVEPYSVAQHSVLASQLVPPDDALAGLLHDASEAYLHDIASPVKRHARMDFYRAAEERLMAVIFARFRLPWPPPESIKSVDRRLRVTEARDLFPRRNPAWRNPPDSPAYDFVIRPYPARTARELFLSRFDSLYWVGGRLAPVRSRDEAPPEFLRPPAGPRE